MPTINNQTLIIAIQAVAAEIRNLRSAISDGDAEPELLQLLEDYQNAAENLERAYDVAAQTALNLPPYNELVGR
jgi:hypothetical protein